MRWLAKDKTCNALVEPVSRGDVRITPQYRWETELGNGIVKTERIRVPYRFNSQKTSSTRDPSYAESAIRPKKKVNY